MASGGDEPDVELKRVLSAMLSITQMKVNSETRSKPTLQTLPLEIKNGIFSHLLLGEKIKTLPSGRPPIAKYNWHTSILRVNRALGNEAKAYLYSHNTFAIIRSDTTRLLKRIIECSLLPVVSYSPGKFKHHSLEVRLQYTDFVVPDCVQCPSSPASDPRVVLLLQQDLRTLCDQLALMQNSARSSSIFILSPPGTKPIKMWSHFYPSKRYMFIEARKNPFDPQLKAAEKKKKREELLKPFAVIRSHSQDVKIVGDVNQSLVDRTIKAMRPRIVWADAVAWDLHDRLRKEKARLDEVLKLHPQAGASLYHAYHQLALFGGSGFLFQKPDDRTSIAEVTLPTEAEAIKKSWQYHLTVIVLDCLVVASGLAIRANQRTHLTNATSLADTDIHRIIPIYAEIPLDLRAMVLYYLAVSFTKQGDSNSYITAFMHTCNGFGGPNPSYYRAILPECHADWKHDQGIIQRELNGPVRGTDVRRFKLALRQPGWKTVLPNGQSRPEGVAGWINTRHELDAATVKILEDTAIRRAGPTYLRVMAGLGLAPGSYPPFHPNMW